MVALFFKVNANTALPCWMASLRLALEEERVASNGSEEGKEAASNVEQAVSLRHSQRNSRGHLSSCFCRE